jgi:hypothetical protein
MIWRPCHFFCAPQSEVHLPSPLADSDVTALSAIGSQLREGLFREAAATFLAVRETNPESVLCAGCA